MHNRTIETREEMEDIIRRCQVCHIGMVDPDGNPYVLPLNFGYNDGTVYLHSAQHGKKINILKNHPEVCIAFSTDYLLRCQNEEVACSYSMKYRSVLCYGTVEFIEDAEEKRKALTIVMQQYTGKEFSFNSPAIREVNCWIVKVRKFEGRVYGY